MSPMSNSKVIFALAKVLIAAAWSDGKITEEEIYSLKDLLFRLPSITGREWANLEMYLETPIDADERKELIEDLGRTISSPEDKKLALKTLEEMVEADGVLSKSEKLVVEEVHVILEKSSASAFGHVVKFLKNLMVRRFEKLSKAPNRELQFDDFIKNKVYYKVQQKLKKADHHLDISENDLRKLCLAGGMMARIAQLDKVVCEEESKTIIKAFKKHWKVSDEIAHFIAEVSLSEDCLSFEYYRLTRNFYTITTEEERLKFINILFDVAFSDGEASYNEIEEIRKINQSLKLDHQQFILAKTNK